DGNSRLALRLELGLQRRGIARDEEAEADPAFLAEGRVVEPVGLHQPLRIAAPRYPAKPALVDEAVMRQRIKDAVKENTEPDPGARLPGPRPHDHRAPRREHRYAHHGADEREAVILLKHAVMRLVMVAVPRPAKAVHDIFMARPCDSLHRRHGGKYGEDDRGSRHGSNIDRSPCLCTPPSG